MVFLWFSHGFRGFNSLKNSYLSYLKSGSKYVHCWWRFRTTLAGRMGPASAGQPGLGWLQSRSRTLDLLKVHPRFRHIFTIFYHRLPTGSLLGSSPKTQNHGEKRAPRLWVTVDVQWNSWRHWDIQTGDPSDCLTRGHPSAIGHSRLWPCGYRWGWAVSPYIWVYINYQQTVSWGCHG